MYAIIRLVILILALYFIVNLIRATMSLRHSVEDLRKKTARAGRAAANSRREGVIELDRDQYRVD